MLSLQIVYTNVFGETETNNQDLGHPLVQGFVHEQMKEDWYRYTILACYVLAGIIGAITAWVFIIYIQWLASASMFNW